jgi:hypothetical protein
MSPFADASGFLADASGYDVSPRLRFGLRWDALLRDARKFIKHVRRVTIIAGGQAVADLQLAKSLRQFAEVLLRPDL